jgi:hypothetical protein
MQWEYSYWVDYLLGGKKFLDEWEKWFHHVVTAGRNGWEMCGFATTPSMQPGTNGMWVMGIFRAPVPAAIDTKQCPRCAEDVKEQALVCRYCAHEFPEPEPPPTMEDRVSQGEDVVDVTVHAFGVEWGRASATGETVYREMGTSGWTLYVPGETSLVPPPGY